MDMLDCENVVYERLLANNYHNLDDTSKRTLVSQELWKYLVDKINNYYDFNGVCEKYNTKELINYLSDSPCIIPIIRFLLNIIGEMQNQKVCWQIYNNKKDVNIVHEGNNITYLYSGTNYSYIFNYIHDYYLNKYNFNIKRHILTN